ncbi:MAG: cytochrome c peroxidase [Ferruginibacter sp.]
MSRKQYFTIVFLVAGMYACNKEIVKQAATMFQKPPGFPETVYHFEINPVSKEGFELGRKLFYDPILSADNTISCGSCHIQTAAFTQHGHSVSHGIFNRLGNRNSQPIMNLAWSKSFMWDGGVFDLDLQPVVPITNPAEMGDTVANVLVKLRSSAAYKALFQNAFGSAEITSADLFKALSQFMLMCVSSNSKYDSVMQQRSSFTATEQEGYVVFKQKCNSCHAEPLFTDHTFRNNGLAVSSRNDKGRFAVTLQETDKYKFRVPSLRNLDHTVPYMHDGRFFSIDAVLDHYTGQVQKTENLDPLLLRDDRTGIALSSTERTSLKAFLKTLNDRSFITNPLLSEQ